jgi:hypothetical protein
MPQVPLVGTWESDPGLIDEKKRREEGGILNQGALPEGSFGSVVSQV